jgi:hypothetical protein
MLRTIVSLAAIALAPAVASAVTVYSETFDNTTGSRQAVSTVGWFSYVGSDTTIDTTASTTAEFGATTGTNGSAINNLAGIGGTGGFLTQGVATAPMRGLLFTEKEEVQVNIAEIETVSWYQLNRNGAHVSRLAIRIGTQWYVSKQNFGSPHASGPSNFPTEATLRTTTITTVADDWYLLNFSTTAGIADINASPTSPAEALSGTISAIGIYTRFGGESGFARFDNFTVTAIPEPAASLMIIGGLPLLLRRGH